MRNYFCQKGESIKNTQIISFANQKGGVGKTTSAFNLAQSFVRSGKSVLMVDNDVQGNLTQYAIGDNTATLGPTVDEFYLSKHPIKDICEIIEGLFLVGSSPELAGVEYYLVSRPDREAILRSKLNLLRGKFDFIFIDNPPSLNLLTINGLVASDGVLVPVQPEYFSLEGIQQIRNSLEDLKKWHNVKLRGIFLNMFDDRRKLNSDVRELLKETFADLLFETVIHNSVKIPESSGHAKSVFQYAPTSRSSHEYSALAHEILARLS